MPTSRESRVCKDPSCQQVVHIDRGPNAHYCSDACKAKEIERKKNERVSSKKKRTGGELVRTSEVREGAPVKPPVTPRVSPDQEKQPKEKLGSRNPKGAYEKLMDHWVKGQTCIEVSRFSRRTLDGWNGDPNHEDWKLLSPSQRFNRQSFGRLRRDLSREFPVGGFFQVRFLQTGVSGFESLGRPVIFELEPSVDEEDMGAVVKIYEERINDLKQDALQREIEAKEAQVKVEGMKDKWFDAMQEQAKQNANLVEQKNASLLEINRDMLEMFRDQSEEKVESIREAMQMQNQQQMNWMNLMNQQQQSAADAYHRSLEDEEDRQSGMVMMMQQQSQQQQNMMMMMMQQQQQAQQAQTQMMMGFVQAIMAQKGNDPNQEMMQKYMDNTFSLQKEVLKLQAPQEAKREKGKLEGIFEKYQEKVLLDALHGEKGESEPHWVDRIGDIAQKSGIPNIMNAFANRIGAPGNDASSQSGQILDWSNRSGLRDPQTPTPSQMAHQHSPQVHQQELHPPSNPSPAPQRELPPERQERPTPSLPSDIFVPPKEMLPQNFFDLVTMLDEHIDQGTDPAKVIAVVPTDAYAQVSQFDDDSIIATVQTYSQSNKMKSPHGSDWLRSLVQQIRSR